MDLSKNIGIIPYVMSTLWLAVPVATFIAFSNVKMISTPLGLKYCQFFFTLITLSIGFYLVDKNVDKSKFRAIMSSIHNSLIIFTVMTALMYFNIFEKCLNETTQKILFTGLTVAVFINQLITTNKNNKSEYNILIILGLTLLQIFRIYRL